MSADWPRLGRIANASISEVIGSGRTWRAVRIGHVPDEVRSAHEPEEVRPPADDPAARPAPALKLAPSNRDSRPARRAVRMKTPVRRGRYHLPSPPAPTDSRARRRPHDRPRDAGGRPTRRRSSASSSSRPSG